MLTVTRKLNISKLYSVEMYVFNLISTNLINLKVP